jgi:hypothetical protein
LKTAKERQYFEIDHYDFHKVSKVDALENPFVWKSNLLGGGRLVPLINKLTSFQSLKDFLDQRKKKGWVYGDGIIEGKKTDNQITQKDLEEKKYKSAEFITNKRIFNPSDFDEKGIHETYICERQYFQRSRNTKKEIFLKNHLLIKKNIGNNSIPCILLNYDMIFKNEVIGIHASTDETEQLTKVYNRIKDNSLYRFYILTTSARSGVSRSTKTTLQKDILGIPFPEDEKEIELTKFDEILVMDTLKYGLEYLGKDTNVKVLETTTEEELSTFGKIFCEVLNLLFETESKKYVQKSIYQTESFICTVFEYGNEMTFSKTLKTENEIENHIAQLVYNKLGTSYRINRVVKVYDGDLIYLVKPKELRYWLQSIALRDADETIVDLYNAGY